MHQLKNCGETSINSILANSKEFDKSWDSSFFASVLDVHKKKLARRKNA